MRSQGVATAEVDLIVSAVPTPVPVADYTPIVKRFDGTSADYSKPMTMSFSRR